MHCIGRRIASGRGSRGAAASPDPHLVTTRTVLDCVYPGSPSDARLLAYSLVSILRSPHLLQYSIATNEYCKDFRHWSGSLKIVSTLHILLKFTVYEVCEDF